MRHQLAKLVFASLGALLLSSCEKVAPSAMSQTIGDPKSDIPMTVTCPLQTNLRSSMGSAYISFSCSGNGDQRLLFFGNIKHPHRAVTFVTAPGDALRIVAACPDNETAEIKRTQHFTHGTIDINCVEKTNGNSSSFMNLTVPSVHKCSKPLPNKNGVFVLVCNI